MGYFLRPSDIGVYSAAARFALPLTIVLNGLTTPLFGRVRRPFMPCGIFEHCSKRLFFNSPVYCRYWIHLQYSRSLAGSLAIWRSLPEWDTHWPIALPSICLSILICPVGVVGYSLGLVRVYWIINLFQLTLVVLIDLALLPRLGPLGAAIALVINEIVGFLIAGWIILRRISASDSSKFPCKKMNYAESH